MAITHSASSRLPTDFSRTGHETRMLGAVVECHDLGRASPLASLSCSLSLGRVNLNDLRGRNDIMDVGMSGLWSAINKY